MADQAYQAGLDAIRAHRLDEALSYFKEQNSCYPENADIFLALEHCRMGLCDWTDWDARKGKVEEVLYSGAGTFPLCYLSQNIPLNLFSLVAKKRAIPFEKHPQHSLKKGKVKLAYLSIDFRSHSAGLPLHHLIGAHDRSLFEVYGYSLAARREADAELKGVFDQFFEVYSLHPVKLKELIQSHGIQILIDTTRHILDSPTILTALKPAPIMISGWGYGESSGSGAFDYILADREMVSPDQERYFVEKVLFLPIYHPIAPNKPEVIISFQDKQVSSMKNLLLGHFNATYKIQPDIFKAWMRILAREPNACLVMTVEPAQARAALLRECERCGVDPKRIKIEDRCSQVDHLKRISEMDLILDNPFFGGGSSLVDSVRLGVPCMTVDGGSMQSRSGRSILSSIGLERMVASSLSEYEENTICYLKNQERLNSLKLECQHAISSLSSNWRQLTLGMDRTLLDCMAREEHL